MIETTLVSLGQAIKCYVCKSYNDRNCEDPFSANQQSDFAKDCDEYYRGSERQGGTAPPGDATFFCRKSTQHSKFVSTLASWRNQHVHFPIGFSKVEISRLNKKRIMSLHVSRSWNEALWIINQFDWLVANWISAGRQNTVITVHSRGLSFFMISVRGDTRVIRDCAWEEYYIKERECYLTATQVQYTLLFLVLLQLH